MTEEAKNPEIPKEGRPEEAKTWEMPEPVLPELKMPEVPKAGKPENGTIVSCEGDIKEDPFKKDNSHIPEPLLGIPKILIGIPILSYNHEFVESFLKFWTQICVQAKGKIQVGYFLAYRKPVHLAEIQLTELALWNKCTHILFMDDDIYDIQLSDLEKLVAADKEVIGGVMYASKFPFAMCVFRRYNTERKVIDMPSDNSIYRLYEVPCTCPKCGLGLSHWDAKFCPACGTTCDNLIQKADLIPFAFTLMKTSIFSKIKKPWFHCEDIYPTDSWFADRCIEAGIQEYAHMGVRLNHAGVNDITRSHMFNMELQKRQQQQSSGLIALTQEDMAKHQYMLHAKMVEAENKLKPQPTMVITGDTSPSTTGISSTLDTSGSNIKEVSDDSEDKGIVTDIQVKESVKVSS